MSHRSATAIPHNTQIYAIASDHAREQENHESGGRHLSGALKLAKVGVEGANPFARSKFP